MAQRYKMVYNSRLHWTLLLKKEGIQTNEALLGLEFTLVLHFASYLVSVILYLIVSSVNLTIKFLYMHIHLSFYRLVTHKCEFLERFSFIQTQAFHLLHAESKRFIFLVLSFLSSLKFVILNQISAPNMISPCTLHNSLQPIKYYYSVLLISLMIRFLIREKPNQQLSK